MAYDGKQEMGRQRDAASMSGHPDVWDNLIFTLQYGWLGAGKLLETLDGKKGIFMLQPFSGSDIVGVKRKRLGVVFKDGEMTDWWANTVFDTCGTVPPPKVSLPEYAEDETIQNQYRDILDELTTILKSRDCELQRVEGTLDRVEKFTNKVLRRRVIFRGVYLESAVKASTGPNTDLVVFVANDPQGGPLPDGGATGPPGHP